MKVEIMSENRIKNIIDKELSKKLNYLESELDKMRIRLVDLERMIKIIK